MAPFQKANRSGNMKINLFYFLFIVSSLNFFGCSYFRWANPYHQLSDGRRFPKKPRFIITPINNYQDSIINFSSAYVWENIWTYEEKTYQDYNHFLFWPTGECFQKATSSRYLYNDHNFFDNKKGWSMGFYRIKDSNIEIEIYVPHSYNRYFGTISSNEIHITRIDLKYGNARFTYSTPVNEHYFRYNFGKFSYQPDWSPTGILHHASDKIKDHLH